MKTNKEHLLEGISDYVQRAIYNSKPLFSCVALDYTLAMLFPFDNEFHHKINEEYRLFLIDKDLQVSSYYGFYISVSSDDYETKEALLKEFIETKLNDNLEVLND